MSEKLNNSKKQVEPKAAGIGASSVINFSSSRAILLISAFTVALAIFLIYLPALNNGFVYWDDGEYVTNNNHIRSIDIEFFKWVFTSGVAGLWHPLTLISYAVDYAIWGLDPWGYHLTNNLFHTLNTFFVFILSVQLVTHGNGLDNKALIVGIVTSLLFGIHPLHVESVAWVSERKDVLSSFFYLLSLLAYLKYASALNSKRYLFYGICLVSFILSLMSKPMAISLPIVLLVLDFYPLGRIAIRGFKNWKGVLIEKMPFFSLSLLSALITIRMHYLEEGLFTIEEFPIIYRALIAIHAYIFYLVKMIVPLNLAPLYPHPPKISPFDIEYLGSFLLLLAITFLCIWSFKRNKLFSAIWVYYITTLIPVIGIVQVGRQSAADRYTYLPSIGVFLLVGLGVAYIYERYSKRQTLMVLIAVLIVISVILTKITVRQIAIWHDPITLWSHEIRIFPDSASVAYANRAVANIKLENYLEAIKDLNMAIKLDPQYTEGYINRGFSYDKLRDYEQAIKDYDKVIEVDFKSVYAYMNRGSAYNSLGKYQEAIRDYNSAIQLNPDFAYAYYGLGIAYSKSGNIEQSIINYKKAADLGLKEAQDYLNEHGVK